MRLDRADNVPAILLPFTIIFWVVWTIWLVVAHAILHLTCRIERIYADSAATYDRPHIYCCWHENIVGFLAGQWTFKTPYVIIINYDWYMPPVHWFAWRMRTKRIIRFFPLETNITAADDAIASLRQGYSQFHLPDGPRGPLRILKKGILHIAAEARVSVVPVKVEATVSLTFPFSWDKKRVPLPFSKITLFYGHPVLVNKKNFAESEKLIKDQLG